MIRRLINLINYIKGHSNRKLLAKYAIIGIGTEDKGIRLRLDSPTNHIYLHIGDNCIVFGNFIFESSSGCVTIGNHSVIGRSTFISRSSIEIGDNVNISWGGIFMTMTLIQLIT